MDICAVEAPFDKLVDYFRDKTLNDLPEFKGLNPSIEHFARTLCQSLCAAIEAPNISMITLKLWENEIAWAAYRLERGA